MRKPMMAGNWKMNKTWAESVVLAQGISNRCDDAWDAVDVVLCPPACNLKAVHTVLEFDRRDIHVGAQNCHWEEGGAFTGEISIPMLEDIGVDHCIVGHSERREYFSETDEMVNRKVMALVAHGVTPIVCVGESLAVRDAGTYLEFICNELRADFAGLEPEEAAKCVVAYEPIWAIGTGRTATPEQAQEVCSAIRAALSDLFGEEVASGMRVLYGGSMKPTNVDGLMAQPDIDGGLIGGAALSADSFAELVEACLK